MFGPASVAFEKAVEFGFNKIAGKGIERAFNLVGDELTINAYGDQRSQYDEVMSAHQAQQQGAMLDGNQTKQAELGADRSYMKAGAMAFVGLVLLAASVKAGRDFLKGDVKPFSYRDNGRGDWESSQTANMDRPVNTKYIQQSPIDYEHVLKADYNKNGKPTGGHTLIFGDVRIVPGSESLPDVSGVYKANIEVPDPKNPGGWIPKPGKNHTMFPKGWDEIKIKTEVDAAWNSSNKIIQGDKWISITPSGVKVQGYITPNATVYPVYQTPKIP